MSISDGRDPKYGNIKTVKNDNSELEISGEISLETIVEYRKRALKEIGETINAPGFRKGHVPEKVIIERLGEVYVLEEAAELVLKDIGPEVVEKHAPDYIGRPHIAITKLAPGNPIGFKITVAVVPDITLPDYKKLAHAETVKPDEPVEITDKEVDDVIGEIRKQQAHRAFHEINKDQDGHAHSEADLEKHLPEFNDEFVKSFGNFENVADFRNKARENLAKEKRHRQMEKKRGKMLESLIENTKIKVPQVLIDGELEKITNQFEAEIKNLGLTFEGYLKHIKKTPEDLRKEWLPDAEKRAKLNLILEKIAKEEKIVPEKEIVDHEVEHLKEHYKDADPLRLRLYVEHTLTLEKTIQFLEKQK